MLKRESLLSLKNVILSGVGNSSIYDQLRLRSRIQNLSMSNLEMKKTAMPTTMVSNRLFFHQPAIKAAKAPKRWGFCQLSWTEPP